MTGLIELLARFAPLLGTIAAVAVVLTLVNWFLQRRWRDKPDTQFRFQLIMLALSFAGLLAIVVALPVNDALRGQLLSLIGILLTAAIALSSTTFIGNIMAGIMLKIVRKARPGDFITVADLTGRITEMDLLHTEIQTEFRDLVTVPNIYMVTHPLQVVRASGSIITAEVSLGFDVSHNRVADVLGQAAEQAGLKDAFVHVRELGDFSVTYRVAGLLEDVQSLISARSELRVAMLDALHAAGIEIVSPNFMNTRALDPGEKIIPRRAAQGRKHEDGVQAEDVAFDKAEDAASVEKLRLAIEQIDEELAALADSDEALADARTATLEKRKARLLEVLKAATEQLKAPEPEKKPDA
jgi:small conductance mechanosensitive channel